MVPPSPPKVLQPTSGDQKAVSTSPQAEDQSDVSSTAKKKKGTSKTVVAWRAMKEAVPEDRKITVKPEFRAKNPKRGKGPHSAGERFARYQDGMTVKQYTEVMHSVANRTPAQTMGDIKWDIAAGFITIS